MKWRKFLSVASLAVLFCMVAISVQAKTFVYCSEGSPEGFTPALYTSGTTFDASSRQLFDKLAMFERGTTKIIPGLATSWDVSADGKTYTFHLRKGVDFHTTSFFTPTRQFNADDVIFSFMRQFDKTHPYHKISGGSYEYFNGMSMPDLIQSIEKKDDYTVVFNLNKPESPFIANMAMDFASIHSAEYADKMLKAGTPDEFDQKPVGTGPFVFVSYQKDSTIRYIAFDKYWKGRAKIDKLVFSITPDASVRYAKLKAGEAHLMPYPNPADIKAMKKDASIQLMEQEGLNVGYLAFNVTVKEFENVKVRQALSMAINKQAIIDAVFQDSGKIAKNPIPPTIWSYNDKVKDYPYDVAGAKKLLAEAGYPNGFETDIWAMPVQRPYNPNARRMAEIIQEDWSKVGVKAKIISYEWGEYLKRSMNGEHSTVLLGWTGDNGDPDNFLAVLLGCDAVGASNRAQWCYKPFDDLLMKAKQVSDIKERTKLYEQAQVIFKEQAPWVTIAHSIVYKPMSKQVVDFKIDPFGGHVFYGVDLK
ncbi:ABC transporter substrate-binding protein [Desulfobacula sp.]|uniref:ABC transporter substrate-binding protein n=1 Tax=Desulfobacula sp. TaxID=2593537 RepID=UPI002606B547|nr:ABC transporter substrate-binding protein [Desulfobacula sp.]